MNLLAIDANWQPLVTGTIVISAVSLDVLSAGVTEQLINIVFKRRRKMSRRLSVAAAAIVAATVSECGACGR